MSETRPFSAPDDCPKCGALAAWIAPRIAWSPSADKLFVTCSRCGYGWLRWCKDAPVQLIPEQPTPEQEAAREIERLLNGEIP